MTARAITNDRHRARALGGLVVHLPETMREPVWQEVVGVLQRIEGDVTWMFVMGQIAAYVPESVVPSLLQTACGITDNWARAYALRHLAPRVSEPDQTALWQEALQAAIAIEGGGNRCSALVELVPQLRLNLLPIALKAACGSRDHLWRHQTIIPLASRLVEQGIDIPIVHWHLAVRTLATYGRPNFLQDLVALMPWLAALATPDDLAEIAQSIIDIAHCWP